MCHWLSTWKMKMQRLNSHTWPYKYFLISPLDFTVIFHCYKAMLLPSSFSSSSSSFRNTNLMTDWFFFFFHFFFYSHPSEYKFIVSIKDLPLSYPPLPNFERPTHPPRCMFEHNMCCLSLMHRLAFKSDYDYEVKADGAWYICEKACAEICQTKYD